MRQLSGIDAAFLQMETPTTYAHVASVAVFDPAPGRMPLTLPGLHELLAARVHRAPVLRQRLLTVPGALDRPYWVDDADFSLDRHLHTWTLPAPGDDHRLSEHVARLVARPLDRAWPLWQLHLVNGLAGGRFALVGIVHHAAADGVMGRDLLATLLDLEPEPPADPAPPPWQPEPVPGHLGRLLRGVVGLATQPLRVAELQRRSTSRALSRFLEAGSALPGAAAGAHREGTSTSPAPWTADASPTVAQAPRAPFNRAVSGRRAWAFAKLPRDRVRQVRQATDTSANEVLLAVTAGALRRWLADHGGVPGRPLRVMVPVSTRPRGGAEDGGSQASDGNAVSFMVAELPTQHADPLQRLRAVSHSARQARALHERHDVAETLATFSELAVPGLLTAAARLANSARVTDWMAPAVNLVVSSVPGPTFALYLRGARLLAAYPVSVVTDGFGLNVTMLATEHDHDIGLTACRELVPDLWQLAAGFEHGLHELHVATSRS